MWFVEMSSWNFSPTFNFSPQSRKAFPYFVKQNIIYQWLKNQFIRIPIKLTRIHTIFVGGDRYHTTIYLFNLLSRKWGMIYKISAFSVFNFFPLLTKVKSSLRFGNFKCQWLSWHPVLCS